MEKVETFEDYGIKIPYRRIHGNVKCVCPKCRTSGRTHPEDRSLSVNLDAAIWNCHYCGWSGGLKGYDRSKINWKGKREYTKPNPIEDHGLSQKLINYFSLRGISLDTLKKMGIAEGKEFMPQVNKEMNTVQFPYYLDGELVNIKYRTGDKKFKMVQGAELIPYNIDGIKDTDTAYICEGECYDDKAQVLTPSGWKLFSELREEETVAQWENGNITFAKPLAIVRKPFKGDLVEFKNSRRNYYSLTTPKHNLVTIGRNGKTRKVHAEDITYQRNVPRCGFSDGKGIPLSDEYIRLLVAISADFTIRDSGAIYGAVKKRRKAERMKWLLETLGIRHSINIDKRGYSSIFIHRGGVRGAFKEFPFEWLSLASARQIQVILDELVLWDGNNVRNRTMKEYSTKLYHNAVWVQTLCHLGGMTSTICHRSNQWGEWYKVTMLFKDHSTVHRGMRTDIPYDGMVYCCTMPAGTLLVRQNDLITVSGNCDALSFVEAGIDNVISVPNGANKNLEWLDDFMEWFDDKKTIYIAVDNDEKGVMLKEELVRRFGAERCMIVNWSDGCKDANDQLKKYGKESLRYCVDAAQDVKVGGIYYLEDYESNLDMLYRRGAPKGMTAGWPNLDNLISFTTKRIMIVTGIPGCLVGETQVLLTNGTTKPISDIQVGDDVFALDGTYNLVNRKVLNKWDSGEKECYKLTTVRGRTLIATGDHKIKTFNGMKPLKEITEKDFVSIAGFFDTQNKEGLSVDQLALVAIWIAEGTKHFCSYYVTSGNPYIVSLMERVCGSHRLKFNRKRNYLYSITVVRERVDGRAHVVSDFVPMHIIRELGLGNVDTKNIFIPNAIKCLGNDKISWFLNILISCDGCISSGGIEYSSNSERLCRDIQELLARLGINSIVSYKKVNYNNSTRDHYRVIISDYLGVKTFAEKVGLTGHTEKLNKYLLEHKDNYKADYLPSYCKEEFPHGDKYYKKHLGLCVSKNDKAKTRINRRIVAEIAKHEGLTGLLNKISNSGMWEQVKSVEYVGIRHTYDIEVDTDHNFVANGILVSNSGKSQFMLEIAVRLNLRYGWRVAFFSPESQPMESHAQELIQVLIGKSFRPDLLHMNESEYQMGKDYIRNNFFHIMPEDNQTIATILEKAQFLVRRRGIKMLVIDPYSSIDSDFGNQSETNYIRAMLEALRNFAIRNDLLVCLVAHPTKIRKDKDHDGIPTMYDVAGSAHFLNKTDYGVVVYRNFEDDYTMIRVEKVKSRFLGHKGDALFKFNINNGRYVPWEKDYAMVSWDNSNWLLPSNAQSEAQPEEQPPQDAAPPNYGFDPVNADILMDKDDYVPF